MVAKGMVGWMGIIIIIIKLPWKTFSEPRAHFLEATLKSHISSIILIIFKSSIKNENALFYTKYAFKQCYLFDKNVIHFENYLSLYCPSFQNKSCGN